MRYASNKGLAGVFNCLSFAAGRSIEEAVWLALKLERACRVQLLAEAAGGPKLLADGEDLTKKSKRANRADLHTNVFNYLLRRWTCMHCADLQ